MKGKTESESLKVLLITFLKIAQVKNTLKFICENNLYGCEKWFQIEFMKFLSCHKDVVREEVCKEEKFDYDKRREFENINQRIDLTFRVKNKQYYHALELKHKPCFSITSINDDLSKLDKAKPSEKVYFRKIFSILIHPFHNEDIIDKKLVASDFKDKFEYSLKIPTTTLSCSVFSADI